MAFGKLSPVPHFDARDLLDCYARGVFPMADAREDDRIFLIDPEQRGVIPLDRFHVSRRLARTVRRDLFEVRFDTAFRRVVRACAETGPQMGKSRTETWINHPIEELYVDLHETGFAHSVECWQDGDLVGGLYGVSLKGAFFGESMFSRARDASKVALVHLAARLIQGGYRLLDTQFMTEHLRQFGAEEIPRRTYRRRLEAALKVEGRFQASGASSSGGGGSGGGGGGVGGAGIAGLELGAAEAAGLFAVPTAVGDGGEDACGASGLAAGLGGGAAPGAGALALQLISQAS